MKDISTKNRRNTDMKHFHSFNTMQITETCLEFELKVFFCVLKLIIRTDGGDSPSFNINTHNDVTGLMNRYESRFTDGFTAAQRSTFNHNIQHMTIFSSTNVTSHSPALSL